ncbi:SOS response-associated peptidase family protein [Pseudomonas sp. S75]|uniref:SOS response-associated peptidase family protein n=1 Tax=unclassified Pseudomonas TaxID=196821 RepID=UPI0019074C03|nr:MULTISPECIES: SOS response-associated peptidase family protein [unclassified Pseudomonas]MBJ9975253.1 SOS response-associated peptidase family protein [Pseudomonas sp. S30]MBK0152773.1 SOS response-associated peptidase family protein [Pseudomonas sp. S75]
MCGRYSIYESMDHYLRQLSLELVVIDGYDDTRINRYNVAPSSRVQVIRPVPGGVGVDTVKWGWSPSWARGKRVDPINARVETLTSNRFFTSLWPAGRALAPANGWFEWVSDPAQPKRKQACYISARSGEPLYFAALAQVHDRQAVHAQDGFVILTAAADEGLVALHERKPVVLTPDLAREWVDAGTTPMRAEEITREGGRPCADFIWHPVGAAVGNVRNEGAGLIEPMGLVK